MRIKRIKIPRFTLKTASQSLLLWPSWPFLPPTIGSAPLGVLAFPAFISRFSQLDIVLWVFYALTVLSAVTTLEDLPQVAKLLIGPSILLLQKNIITPRFALMGRVLVFILLVDAIISAEFNSLRGGTFLTLEPSHSAQFFFSTFLLIYLYQKKLSRFDVVLCVVFLLTNRSMFGFVFFAFLMFFLASNEMSFRKIIKKIVIIVLFFTISISFISQVGYEIRFVAQIQTIMTVFTSNYDDMAKLLYEIGSRRLLQSLAGFFASDFNGAGLTYAPEEFILNSRETSMNLSAFSRVVDLAQSPTSYGAQIYYELGWLRATFMLFIIIMMMAPGLLTLRLFALLLFFAFSTTTSPFCWIFFGFSDLLAKRKVDAR
jgi:hypothetical protein